jgi:hypothetical protein
VVTSHHAVGYVTEVRVGFDDGFHTAGRVVAVDVRRDLAFVLPRKSRELSPLPAGFDLPRMGDAVLVLRRQPSQAFGLTAGVVTAVDPEGEHYEADAAHGARGAPLLSTEGQVLGVCVEHWRGPLGRPVRPSTGRETGVVVPMRGLQNDLLALDQPASQLAGREPVYRCLSCDEPFTLEHDACLACGGLLPFAPSAEAVAGLGAGPQRGVKELLQTLEVVANRVRVGPRAWRFIHQVKASSAGSEVTLQLDESGHHVFLRAPVVRLPQQYHEPFYRLLLTMNDLTTGPFRVSIQQDRVILSYTEPLASLRGRELVLIVRSLVILAGQYRHALSDAFGAEPLSDTAGPE